jgi:Zn-dependent protease with chaperone function
MMPALAAIVAAAIIVPHALRLRRAAPVTAIVLWLSSLALRALIGVLGVIVLLFFLPRTALFDAVSHWCLHVALPATEADVDVEGHRLADGALYLPGLALLASLLYFCARTVRDAHVAKQLVDRGAIGYGPRDSVILGDPSVLFAVAGLARPRVLVSAGALAVLDDDELTAALDHEQAHIARRHRFVMLVALGLRSLGRAVPGSQAAVREVAFHLERDADRWALRRRNDRLALASVICKSAITEPPQSAVLAQLGAAGVTERLAQLLDDRSARGTRSATAALGALATLTVTCTLLLAPLVPAAAVAGAAGDAHRGHHGHHCHH